MAFSMRLFEVTAIGPTHHRINVDRFTTFHNVLCMTVDHRPRYRPITVDPAKEISHKLRTTLLIN